MKKWEAKPVLHKGEARIAVYFEKDPELIGRIKKLAGVHWSQTLKAWHLPDNDSYRKQFQLPARQLTQQFLATHKASLQLLSKKEQNYLIDLENLLRLKAYSESTVRAYRNEFCVFLRLATGCVNIETLTQQQLQRYLLYLIEKRQYGESRLNMAVSVLKFFYEQVSCQPRLQFELPRPRKKQQLPKVIAREQVLKLLDAPVNKKHRAMLMCAYAAGLRVSEVANLKITDVDSLRMTLRIVQSKGKKDRYVMLSQKLLQELREYVRLYRPKIYLFEGQYGGAITTRTIQEVFTAAKKKAGILQPVGIHSLRHSFATHLHEGGIDIKYIQDLLGHNSPKTTAIYTHVSRREIGNIKSPFDD